MSKTNTKAAPQQDKLKAGNLSQSEIDRRVAKLRQPPPDPFGDFLSHDDDRQVV